MMMQSLGHAPAPHAHAHQSPPHPQHQRRWSSGGGGGGGGGHMNMSSSGDHQHEMVQQGPISSASASVSTAPPRLSLPPPPAASAASALAFAGSGGPLSPHQQNQQQQIYQQHHHPQQYVAPYHGQVYNGSQVPAHHHHQHQHQHQHQHHRGSGHMNGARTHGGQLIASSRPPHLLSDDEKDEIRMAFELFDTKKCGRITYRELKLAMRALDFDVKKVEVKTLMEEHTKDGNTDEVDMDEFMEILSLKYKERDPDEELAKAFKIFDEDETGKITLKNLRKVARDLGEHITDEELGSMIEEFDNDQDGGINEEEFFNIMKKDDFDD